MDCMASRALVIFFCAMIPMATWVRGRGRVRVRVRGRVRISLDDTHGHLG